VSGVVVVGRLAVVEVHMLEEELEASKLVLSYLWLWRRNLSNPSLVMHKLVQG
jgi:hypothetical protein